MDRTHLDERSDEAVSAPPPYPGAESAYSPERADDIAALLKAAADPTRLRLLHAIATAPGGQAYVQDLVATLEISQPTASHHLRKLLDAGLLERRREGKRSWYSLSTNHGSALRDLLGLSDPST
ncbi:ArsR/SmtB family transcription factor [Nocardiopsis sp. NPDC055879]